MSLSDYKLIEYIKKQMKGCKRCKDKYKAEGNDNYRNYYNGRKHSYIDILHILENREGSE